MIIKTKCKSCNKEYNLNVFKAKLRDFDCCSLKCSEAYFDEYGVGFIPKRYNLVFHKLFKTKQRVKKNG